MRLLLDENMSDRRLGARLRAQGHDPVLATGVGLLSATDARVFIAAITQALPVLTRDSEDFTDLHDLIMAAGGHHSGVLIVRDPEQVRKLAGWGLTQNDIASFVGWSTAGSPSSAWVFNQFTPLRRLAIKNPLEQGHGTQPNRFGIKDLWQSSSRFWKNQARVRNGQEPRS